MPSQAPDVVSRQAQRHVQALETHQVNTLTELCRIERAAASCTSEADARAYQEPMTAAWTYYVSSRQFLLELQGLTRSYPFSPDLVVDAVDRVHADPESNRSWNLAWLALVKMNDDGLLAEYAMTEAERPVMWGEEKEPTEDEVMQLATCFQVEWQAAVDTMLRHWPAPPTWY